MAPCTIGSSMTKQVVSMTPGAPVIDVVNMMCVQRLSCIVICDDGFKLYNDRYGHPAGDDALKRVVREIEGSMRDVDQVYRYGGEELLLALPETPIQGGLTMANRICAAVHDVGIPHQDSAHGVLTISCGVAGLPSASKIDRWRDLVEFADQALYRCKNKGRNCVEVHD